MELTGAASASSAPLAGPRALSGVLRGSAGKEAGLDPASVRADLEKVFRLHYPLVVGVAARVVGSADEAQDVAQEVFLSFARSGVAAADARRWLCVASVHTALNLLRGRRRRASRHEAAAAAAPSVESDVADSVLAGADRARVREALSRLPRRQATALVMRHSGLTYAEVGSALGISTGSVGTTVRRAEAALRKELIRDAPSW